MPVTDTAVRITPSGESAVNFQLNEIMDVALADPYDESYSTLANGKHRYYQKGDSNIKVQITFRVLPGSATLTNLQTLRDFSLAGTTLRVYYRFQQDNTDYVEGLLIPAGQIPEVVAGHGLNKWGYTITVKFVEKAA